MSAIGRWEVEYVEQELNINISLEFKETFMILELGMSNFAMAVCLHTFGHVID